MNQYIWRYLDLTKFIDLLQSKSIKLTRATSFSDPFEGTINEYTHQAYLKRFHSDNLAKEYEEYKAAYLKVNSTWIKIGENLKKEGVGTVLNNALSCIKDHTFINCWHINSYESEAMWRLYSKNIQESVVIKSTIPKITYKAGESFICKPVNYIDYSQETLFDDYFNAPFLQKRLSFKHENEFRIIKQQLPLIDDEDNYKKLELNAKCSTEYIDIYLGDDFENIIDEIIISPFSPKWFQEIIKGLLDVYRINVPLKSSEITVQPFNIEAN